jgi:ribosomal protein S12 methylthiotransferase
VPGIALRTTLIAGHPGETEADFEELCEFVQESKFERLGIFTYSHEENTHSHTLVDDVPAEVKQERADRIMEIQQQISLDYNESRVGQTYNVLFDRLEGGYYVLVLATNDLHIPQGSFAKVHITGASDFDLYGEVVR